MLRTLKADLAAQVDPTRHAGPMFWIWALGKATLQPQVQVVILFRLSHALYQVWALRPVAFMMRSLAVILGSAEIHPAARIAPGFALVHSIGVLIGPGVVIGADARIAHIVSIGEPGRGASRAGAAQPTLGDHVTIGIGSVIIGNVHIGDHAVVGANSVVTRDVPTGAVVAGAPARVIKWVSGFGPQDSQPVSQLS